MKKPYFQYSLRFLGLTFMGTLIILLYLFFLSPTEGPAYTLIRFFFFLLIFFIYSLGSKRINKA